MKVKRHKLNHTLRIKMSMILMEKKAQISKNEEIKQFNND